LEYHLYETPKSGLEDDKNEDSVFIRTLSRSNLMITMSDGASTGVFSRKWSDHICKSIDSAWLTSPEDFEYGIEKIRETFKPNLTRPTAKRKFLLEGSYATVMSLLIQKPSWWFGDIKIKLISIGDISIFVFNKDGELEYSFPQKKSEDFGNVPDLIRSSKRLQEKTPYEIKQDNYSTSNSNVIAIMSDAISEFIFSNTENGLDIIKRIAICKTNDQFRRLVDHYRSKCGMKNDDVSVLLLAHQPELYFKRT